MRVRSSGASARYRPSANTSGSRSGATCVPSTAPIPIVWSPPGSSSVNEHAIHAAAPSSTGTPCSSTCVTDANFSAGIAFEANTRASSPWSAASTLTPKRSDDRTAGSVRDPLSKQTSSRSGSRESDVTAFVVSPAGPSGPKVVTTVTPGREPPDRVAERPRVGAAHRSVTVSSPHMPRSS